MARSARSPTPTATAIMTANDGYASQAMRVLAVAYRNLDQEPHSYATETIEQDLTFVGLVAMIDPPRAEVRDAMAKCRTRASGR